MLYKTLDVFLDTNLINFEEKKFQFWKTICLKNFLYFMLKQIVISYFTLLYCIDAQKQKKFSVGSNLVDARCNID